MFLGFQCVNVSVTGTWIPGKIFFLLGCYFNLDLRVYPYHVITCVGEIVQFLCTTNVHCLVLECCEC